MFFSTVERRAVAVVLGLALLSIASAFLLPLPPGFQQLSRSFWPRLAQVIVTCLLFIVLFLFHSRGERPRWRAMTLGAVAGGLASLFANFVVSTSFTCRYYDNSKIIGSTLTPIAADYLTRYSSSTCEDLIKAFTGHAEEIWTARSLWAAELAIGSFYALIAPL